MALRDRPDNEMIKYNFDQLVAYMNGENAAEQTMKVKNVL